MFWPALIALVSAQAECRPRVVGDGGVAVLSVDLDGDPVPDEVRVLDRDVEIRISKPPSVTRLDLQWESPSGLQVPLLKLPLKGNKQRERVLRFIEETIMTTCTQPDPALQRLRQQGQRGRSTPLNWIDGPVKPTFSYLLRDATSWSLFIPYCYKPGASRPDPFGASPFEEAANEGALVVLKTCHGVVVNDLEHGRHAWLYLLDQPIDKLRHSSIGDVAIADGGVTIQLTLDMLEYPQFVEVKVSTTDGSFKVVKGNRAE